jgi:hypothetical protein
MKTYVLLIELNSILAAYILVVSVSGDIDWFKGLTTDVRQRKTAS